MAYRRSSPRATVNPLGERTSLAYDAAGRQIRQADPLSHVRTTVYDPAGRQVASVDPLGNRSSSTYDAAGRQIAAIDAESHRTSTVYDAAGRTLATINANAHRVTTAWDAAGREIAHVDPRGNRTTWSYDAAGRRIDEVNPLGQRVSFAWDAAGRRTLRIDARGNRTTWTYDAAGREHTRRYPDASRITWTYDNVGNPLVIAGEEGRYTRTYDPTDLVTSVVDPEGIVLTFTYDAVSRRRALDDLTGVTTSAYDAAGRIVGLENPQSGRTTYQYDAAGRRTQSWLGNGSRTTYIHDAADRTLRVVDLRSDDSVISRFDYAYDATGHRTHVVNHDADRTTWSYDPAYQLTAEHHSGPAAYAHTFSYDPAGNRLVRDEDGLLTTSTYDPVNRLIIAETPSGLTTYTYDADGNQRSIETPSGDLTTQSWDYENRMRQVEQPGGDVLTYSYDITQRDGTIHRVAADDGIDVTRFVWDRETILLETDETGTLQAANTWEPAAYGNLESRHADAESTWYHFDAQGSTAALSDPTQVVTDDYTWTAFGNEQTHTGTSDQPFRWIGRQGYYFEEQTGRYNLRARDYAPDQSRFLSQDPLGYDADESNLYRYVENDPTNATDPSGMKPCPLPPFPDCRGVAGNAADRCLKVRESKENPSFLGCWSKPCLDYTAMMIFTRPVGASDTRSVWLRVNADGTEFDEHIGTVRWYKRDPVEKNMIIRQMHSAATGRNIRTIMPVKRVWTAIKHDEWGRNEKEGLTHRINVWWGNRTGVAPWSPENPTAVFWESLLTSFGELSQQAFDLAADRACDAMELFFGQDVCGVIERLVGNCSQLASSIGGGVPKLIDALYFGGTSYVEAVVNGVKDGFQEFGLDGVLDGLQEWLGFDFSQITSFIDNLAGGNWNEAFKGLQSLLGLTTEAIAGAVSQAAGVPFSILMAGLGVLETAIEEGPQAAIEWIRSLLEEKLGDLQQLVKGGFAEFGEDILKNLTDIGAELTGQLIQKAVRALIPGANILQGIISLFDSLGGACANATDIVAGLVKAFATPSAAQETIKTETVKILGRFAPFAAELITGLAGVTNLIDKIRNFREPIRDWIVNLVKSLVEKVSNLAGGLFGKNSLLVPGLSGKTDENQTPFTVYVDRDGVAHVRWNPDLTIDELRQALANPRCIDAVGPETLSSAMNNLAREQARMETPGYKPSKAALNSYKAAADFLRDLLSEVEDCDLTAITGDCDPPVSTTANSSTLGINLGKGPDADVAPSEVSNQPNAHHIVAGAAGDDTARDILASAPVCIDINAAINGVWLPLTSGVGVPPSSNLLGRVPHNRTYSPRYYAYVSRRLRPFRRDKSGAEAVLRELRTELANGQINW